ncbi:MAG: adenylate/guanylate cyclase domain-containing protein [Acidimicrobiia bacterium]
MDALCQRSLDQRAGWVPTIAYVTVSPTSAPDTRAPRPRTGGAVRAGVWVLHLLLPLLGLWLLLAKPELDVHWEHQPSHFWLVMTVAGISVVLAWRVQTAARDHGDARLVLVAAAFVAAAGFLFLHALATPGVMVGGPNTGFFVATPVGLGIAAVFAALSAIEFSPSRAALVVRNQRGIRIGLFGMMAVWAAMSLLALPPLDVPPDRAELSGPLEVLAVVSVALYGIAAGRYFLIHRRRPAVMLVGLITAFALLAEAMVTVVFAPNWQLSWWLWHVLMAAAFGFVAYSAYVQFRREGSSQGLFDGVVTEQTVDRVRTEMGSALEVLTSALERSERTDMTDDDIDLITAGLSARFDLTEGQGRVLGRAARALANERDQTRRLAALAAVGAEARIDGSEHAMLARIVATIGDAFGRDRMRIGLLHEGQVDYRPDLVTGPWDESGEHSSHRLIVAGKPAGTVEFQRPGGHLTDADRAIFETLASELSIALENTRLYEQLDTLFRQYMSPDVASTLLSDPSQASLGGAVFEVTALFADLRGFTTFSERSRPEEVVEMLNRYFGVAVPHVLDHGGTVIQFVGDAMLAVFNAPARQDDHAVQAARAALAMQGSIEQLAAENPEWPLFRIGINTGPALVGNIGSDRMRSFNVMGDAINVAARLEGVAEPGTVVIGETTHAAIADRAHVEPLGDLELKGKELPVRAYRLLAVDSR